MSWLYLWPVGMIAVSGAAMVAFGVLLTVNLLLGLLVVSLYGLIPKDVLFDFVASKLRNKQVEENIQATFQLVQEKESPPSSIFVWQPHGLMSISSGLYNTGVCKHATYRPNRIVTLPIYHYIPVIGDIARYLNIIPSDYLSIKKTLERGESLSLMLGGVREMSFAEGKHMKLYIRNRTGIFRIALETGKPLVPVLTYGENETFGRSTDWITTGLNVQLHKYLGLSIGFPSWKALQNWFELSYKPLKPIVSHVGSPVPVPEAGDVDALRDAYIKAVEDLFGKTAPPGYTLEIV